MSDDLPPEPDRAPGAPHPRDTVQLFGQGAVEAGFLKVYNAGRLHHGWLITGPRGVGKATLAWRIARFLLATPPEEGDSLFGDALPKPDTLDISPDHPVAHRIAARSEPGLYHITRSVNEKTGRLRDMIVAEDVRDLNKFLQLSAADGGRRVVIIDAADEMNVQAANALLKMLEEPPARTTLLLISHQPARLLPTIRSRCRELRLASLSPDDMAAALAQAGIDPGPNPEALAELSAGSVGEAVRLITLDGLALYGEIIGLLGSLPQLDRPRALKLAEQAATRGGEERLDLLLHLTDVALARLARSGATGHPPAEAAPHEGKTFQRLAPTPEKGRAWAACAQEIGARMRHGRAVNLDPAALVLDMVFRMQQTA
ncbi:DNA polymerase III subunit delta' [Roseovarius sp. 2305UL8-3]|uniref:DNA polymerase III subunit delta' n=1 Tax=Roseovarius conchicola TaxID=3121636 RepID=UPI0035290B7F